MNKGMVWCAVAMLLAACAVSKERPARDEGDEEMVVDSSSGDLDSAGGDVDTDGDTHTGDGAGSDTAVDSGPEVGGDSGSDTVLDSGVDSDSDIGPAHLAPPEIIAAVASDQSISVQWYETDEAKTYNLYYKEASTTLGPWDYTDVIEGIPAGLYKSSHVIEGLDNGTTYAVAVTGVNGVVESSFSDVLSAVPTAPFAVPEAPTGVVVISTDDGQVELRWNPVSGADAYTIYYRAGADFGATGQADGASSPVEGANQGIADGLTNQVLYYFHVTASNSLGESGLSPVAVIGAADPAVKILEEGTWVQGRLSIVDLDGDWLRFDAAVGTSYRLYAEGYGYHPVHTDPAPTLDLRMSVLRADEETAYPGLARTGVSEFQPWVAFEALDETVWVQVTGFDNDIGDYWMMVEAQ